MDATALAREIRPQFAGPFDAGGDPPAMTNVIEMPAKGERLFGLSEKLKVPGQAPLAEARKTRGRLSDDEELIAFLVTLDEHLEAIDEHLDVNRARKAKLGSTLSRRLAALGVGETRLELLASLSAYHGADSLAILRDVSAYHGEIRTQRRESQRRQRERRARHVQAGAAGTRGGGAPRDPSGPRACRGTVPELDAPGARPRRAASRLATARGRGPRAARARRRVAYLGCA